MAVLLGNKDGLATGTCSLSFLAFRAHPFRPSRSKQPVVSIQVLRVWVICLVGIHAADGCFDGGAGAASFGAANAGLGRVVCPVALDLGGPALSTLSECN